MGAAIRPSPKLVVLYYVRTAIAAVICAAFLGPLWLAASARGAPALAFASALTAGVAASLALAALWAPLYCRSLHYELREHEIVAWEGVWFKKVKAVPYGMITNVEVRQGPISRALGIASIAVETAGYSARPIPELEIKGVERPHELMEQLLERARRARAWPVQEKG